MRATYLLDANVLVALTHARHLHHHAAHRWFVTITDWAATPMTETALVRLLTNPVVVGHPITPAQALAAVSQVRALPGHRWLPDDSTLAEPRITVTRGGYRQVTDFHLVNLAAASGHVLATFDTKIQAAVIASDQRHVHAIAPRVR